MFCCILYWNKYCLYIHKMKICRRKLGFCLFQMSLHLSVSSFPIEMITTVSMTTNYTLIVSFKAKITHICPRGVFTFLNFYFWLYLSQLLNSCLFLTTIYEIHTLNIQHTYLCTTPPWMYTIQRKHVFYFPVTATVTSTSK